MRARLYAAVRNSKDKHASEVRRRGGDAPLCQHDAARRTRERARHERQEEERPDDAPRSLRLFDIASA